MVSASSVLKSFKTPSSVSSVNRGGVGFDNPRENIDPHVKTKVLNTKEIYYDGVYAEIYADDVVYTQSIPTGTTYTQLNVFSASGANSYYCKATPDAANDRIILDRPGIYKVNALVSGQSGTANVTFRLAVFLNGVEQDQAHTINKYTTANSTSSKSFHGIIDSTSPNQAVDIRVRHDNGGSIDFIPNYCNLCVHYLGET